VKIVRIDHCNQCHFAEIIKCKEAKCFYHCNLSKNFELTDGNGDIPDWCLLEDAKGDYLGDL
jgi:hypothetical protein